MFARVGPLLQLNTPKDKKCCANTLLSFSAGQDWCSLLKRSCCSIHVREIWRQRESKIDPMSPSLSGVSSETSGQARLGPILRQGWLGHGKEYRLTATFAFSRCSGTIDLWVLHMSFWYLTPVHWYWKCHMWNNCFHLTEKSIIIDLWQIRDWETVNNRKVNVY